MYCKLFTLFITLSLLLCIGECLVCTAEFCAGVKCTKVEKCDGPKQVIKPGGFCQCCDKCHTILGENDPCSNLSDIVQGIPPPLAQCGNGLICHEGKCKSFKALAQTAVSE